MNRNDFSKVDWFKLLCDLKRSHIALCQIEKDTHIPKSTLLGFKEGRQPRHDDGEILITYWQQKTKNSRDIVPRLVVYSQ